MKHASDILRAVADGVTALPEIARHCGIDREAARLGALALKRRRLVSQDGLRGAYSLTDAGRQWIAAELPIVRGQGRKPRTVTRGIRERAWWHLRAHKSATMAELITTHATPDLAAPRVTLAKYLSALTRAGILRRRVARPGGEAVWTLHRDLGPQAPVWREKSARIWDPNSDTLFVVERSRP